MKWEYQIINDDCRRALSTLRESADLIVTSPPYADARKRHYDSVDPDKYAEWFMSFHEPFFKALKPNGSLVINIKDKVVDGVRHRYVWETIAALNRSGWHSIDDEQGPPSGFSGRIAGIFHPTALSGEWACRRSIRRQRYDRNRRGTGKAQLHFDREQ